RRRAKTRARWPSTFWVREAATGQALTMAASSIKNGTKMTPAPPDRDSRLEHLMRALLAFAEGRDDAGEQRPDRNGVEEILIDADFEGRRYLLIKMPVPEEKCPPLSPRELEIVRMVAQGHPNKIIAVVLNISAWTVCTHLRRIFAKLGVSS